MKYLFLFCDEIPFIIHFPDAQALNGATTLSIMTLGIMTLSIITLSIMTLSIMTLSIMTLSISVSKQGNTVHLVQ
jgi:hypothetical protein